MEESILYEFIDSIVDTLKDESIDITYVIAPLRQKLLEKEYKCFIEDLFKYTYEVYYNADKTDGYTNGTLEIVLNGADYYYTIDLVYSECTEDDVDWSVPAFVMHKICDIGTWSSWDGSFEEFNKYIEE